MAVLIAMLFPLLGLWLGRKLHHRRRPGWMGVGIAIGAAAALAAMLMVLVVQFPGPSGRYDPGSTGALIRAPLVAAPWLLMALSCVVAGAVAAAPLTRRADIPMSIGAAVGAWALLLVASAYVACTYAGACF